MPLNSRPNRTYTVAVLVVGFLLLIGAGEMVFLRQSPTIDPSARWVFKLIAFIEAIYVLAIATTLALRAWAPAAGQIATTALNIVLLFAFPFGTAVGVYGLWKVDRPPQSGVA